MNLIDALGLACLYFTGIVAIAFTAYGIIHAADQAGLLADRYPCDQHDEAAR